MRMSQLSQVVVAAIIGLSTLSASAVDVVDIAKAQKILNSAMKIVEKYRNLQIELAAPEPLPDSSGKFVVPFTGDGATTEWAVKALTAKAGAAIGAKAAEKASQQLMSKVPFGGLMSHAAKNKGAAVGAITAIGGWDFIRETSDLSFQDLDDFAVYMHVMHSEDADYKQALAATMAVYPKLEKTYKRSVGRAYKDAKKAAKRKK